MCFVGFWKTTPCALFLGFFSFLGLFIFQGPTFARASETSDTLLFKSRAHDFGTLARGARAVHRFQFRNPHDEPMVIRSARSSCGCTRVSIADRVVAPGQKGVILAEFNTRSFLGKKSATITVVIERPVRREIQLRVSGNIRSDVVLDPGALEFRNATQGEILSRTTTIHYAGSDSWKIVDVKSSLDFLQADLRETGRGNGSVKYELTVTMRGDYPAGNLRDLLTIVTNDTTQERIPLSFFAQVSSPLSVSPQSILLEPKPVTRKIILKGKEAFSISRVVCGDSRFEFKYSRSKKKTQLVTIAFLPGEKKVTGPGNSTQNPGQLAVPAEPAALSSSRGRIPVSGPIEIRFETDLGPGVSRSVWATFQSESE